MADIANTQFESKQFDWHADTQTFVEEISTLSQGGKVRVFSQVYDDACDEGFVMISSKTGQRVVYVVDGHDMNDGDIMGWKLIPTRDSIRRVPSCKGTKVLIIND